MSPGSVRARLSAVTVAALAAALVTPVVGTAAPSSAAPSASRPTPFRSPGRWWSSPARTARPTATRCCCPPARPSPWPTRSTPRPCRALQPAPLAVPGTSGDRELSGSLRSSALRRAVQTRTPLRVVEARTSERAPAPGPAAHTTYVAKVTNFGTVG